jgi:hypothetical protein
MEIPAFTLPSFKLVNDDSDQYVLSKEFVEHVGNNQETIHLYEDINRMKKQYGEKMFERQQTR